MEDLNTSVPPLSSYSGISFQHTLFSNSSFAGVELKHFFTGVKWAQEEVVRVMGEEEGLTHIRTGESLLNSIKQFTSIKISRFERYNYTTPTYCDLCTSILWGIVRTGYRCQVSFFNHLFPCVVK